MNVLLLADTHLREGQGARLVDRLCGHLETADVIIHAGEWVGSEPRRHGEVHGNGPVRQVIAYSQLRRGGTLPAAMGGLRPIERCVLRWRDEGADFADLAARFRRGPAFLDRLNCSPATNSPGNRQSVTTAGS